MNSITNLLPHSDDLEPSLHDPVFMPGAEMVSEPSIADELAEALEWIAKDYQSVCHYNFQPCANYMARLEKAAEALAKYRSVKL